MTTWVTIPNPEWNGQEPRIVEAVCHDKSNFLTMRCPWCDGLGHVHESQVAEAAYDDVAAIRCHTCGNVSDAPMGMFKDAFAQMRADGWIE